MYCPKCKNEYRKGIEICPECHLELVEELSPDIEWMELFRSDDEAMINEVGRYFEHIGLKYQITADEETAEAIFSIDSKELKRAKMEAATVVKVYHEKKALEAYENPQDFPEPEEDTDEEEDIPITPAKTFVSAKDRTNDYRSSGILFIVMGLALVAIGLLNYLGQLDFVPARMTQIVMMVLGLACVVGGIASVIKSRSLSREVAGEEAMVAQIKATLAEQYPPLTFAEMMEDTDTTPELRYIQVQEEIKKYMTAAFPEASSGMLDDFIEEYTDSMFN